MTGPRGPTRATPGSREEAGAPARRGARARSTLFTSPRAQADFALRLAFFAVAPFGIVAATAYFPVAGALLNVAIALGVFLAGEAVRAWAGSRRLVRWLLNRELAFERYYRERPPRPFLYYVLYPLLFPYWLWNRDARREFWLFKGYTAGSVVILGAFLAYQYVRYWRPELGLLAFAPVVGVTLGIEALLVLGLLMPISTTVVSFHERRRGRLVALLLVAAVSTGVGVARMLRRRDPVVSFSTRARIWLRTAALPNRAHRAQLDALRVAWATSEQLAGAVDRDGKVQGLALDLAHASLSGSLYKPDEAFAFDLWASPRQHPTTLVLYFEARAGHRPVWAAMRATGEEIRDWSALPKGAGKAMKRAADELD